MRKSNTYTVEELRQLWNKTNKGKAANSEHDLQVECLRWLHLAYPTVLCYAIPNGGYRTKTTAVHMKAEGQTAGVPDLHIPIPRCGYASLYIEMKNGKAGVVSDKQKEMIARLREYGNRVVVCRTFDEFRAEVEEYLSTPHCRMHSPAHDDLPCQPLTNQKICTFSQQE